MHRTKIQTLTIFFLNQKITFFFLSKKGDELKPKKTFFQFVRPRNHEISNIRSKSIFFLLVKSRQLFLFQTIILRVFSVQLSIRQITDRLSHPIFALHCTGQNSRENSQFRGITDKQHQYNPLGKIWSSSIIF